MQNGPFFRWRAAFSGISDDTPLAEDAALPLLGVTGPGAQQALRLTNPRTHLTPATTTGPVTPDGARESGQPWWLAALGTDSRVPQPQSGTTLLPLCLQGPSD